MSSDGACNICGGTAFGPGPGGRLSRTQQLPACSTCGALERHRSLRTIFDDLPLGLFYRSAALQFSRDPSLEPRWFRTFEQSIYGGDNSLDLQQIDRPDNAYDLISLNHVLEFVPNARKAFAELVRISSAGGLIQIGFSEADKRDACIDCDKPSGPHGHYHLFGVDLGAYFDLEAHGMRCCVCRSVDPVTGQAESFHFFARNQAILDTIVNHLASVASAS